MLIDIIVFFLLGLIASAMGTIVGSGGLITLPVMILLNIPVQSCWVYYWFTFRF